VTINPFPLVEMAVKEVIETGYEPAEGKVGGDLSYATGQDLYVWLALVPGGSTDELEGEWNLDIDVFADTYAGAMGHALALEAVLLKRRHATSVMRLDRTYQNEAPVERPWDDDSVYRVGATYTFTARRTD
jgi:hypothetical protein